jgi:DNA-binding response OmpR family regulator
MKLLIIEDDRALSQSMTDYLTMEGHLCESAANMKEGLFKTADNRYDCIILDLGLPDGSGFEIIKELKANKLSDGILILSARDSLNDKLQGLNLGADDYLTKPFHLAELSARINSIYRRHNFNGFNEIKFNEIKVNTEGRQVWVNDRQLNLTRKEYELLVFFIINANRIIAKESIVEHLWGDEVILTDSFDFVYTHVKNLRKKIMSENGRNYIKSIYGFGYKFSED